LPNRVEQACLEADLLFSLLALGDVLVSNNGPRGTNGREGGHPSNEPALLCRRMARIPECKLFSLAREYRTDSLRKRGNFFGAKLYC
jgi:hypothetical protein